MTQPVIPAAGTTPAAPQTSVQTPAVPPAPAAPVVNAPANPSDPKWLDKRIEQAKTNADAAARAALLKELGVGTIEEAKAIADAAKKAADANKTAEQRAADAAAEAKRLAEDNARLTASTKEYAARMMVGLTPEQVAAVTALAGDDPSKQIQTITALSPTWAAASTSTTTTTTTPAPVATTAPPPHAPSGVVPQPGNDRSQYEQLAQSNPFAAAKFGLSKPGIYEPKK